MPTKNTTDLGNCFICGAELGKIKLKNHVIREHTQKEPEVKKGKSEKAMLLKVEGLYKKEYWLFLDIAEDATLADLDDFLRRIWLECCEHMSVFFFYMGRRGSYEEIPMSTKIGSFMPGDKLQHDYDMGDTTSLLISVVDEVWRIKKGTQVRLLARNVPPVFPCKECGKPAACIYDNYAEALFFCKECAAKAEGAGAIEEGCFLPVVNSPRMGQCGYDGEQDQWTFASKDTLINPHF